MVKDKTKVLILVGLIPPYTCDDEYVCPICEFGNNKDESGQWCICDEY